MGILLGTALLVTISLIIIFFSKRHGLLSPSANTPQDSDDRDPATLCRAQPHLLTPAERDFFAILRPITAAKHGLLAKVRVGDILTVPGQGSAQTTARNRINMKHADFVLCDPTTTRPLLIIELDDKSHEAQSRKDRDTFLDAAYKAANLPILHVRAARTYSPAQLETAINTALTTHAAATP